MKNKKNNESLPADTKKGKKKNKIFNRIIFILAVIVLLVSGGMLIKLLIIDPMKNEGVANEIREIYYAEEGPSLEKLRLINDDIVGWIKIDNTPIDYPVLRSEYYLHRNYKKEYSQYGSIFLDDICKLESNPQNILVHGHHMNNGSMFAKICDFTDLNFYKTTPVFSFDTVYSKNKWKIISVFRTNTNPEHGELFNYLQSSFGNNPNSFLEYVYQVKVRSNINTPVDIAKDDELVTLSTCSYELPDFRTVVVARKVRPGEPEDVDTSLAKYSACPLMPDAYYQKFGGSAPEVTSFKEALAKGKIDWYKQ